MSERAGDDPDASGAARRPLLRGRIGWQSALFLLVGLALFALALREVDPAAVWRQLGAVGALGAAAVLGVALLLFLADTAAWVLTIPGGRPGSFGLPGWYYRLCKARLIGEAFNLIVPAGTMGGEPVKAVILKRRYGIGYREGSASVILQRSVTLLSMLAYFAVGLVLAAFEPRLPDVYLTLAASGWAALTLGILGFIAVQRWAVASRVARLFGRWTRAGALLRLLAEIEAVEGHFRAFYMRAGRFAAALALTFLGWVLSVAEVKLVMALLGSPVGWAEAWLLASLVELLRAGLFFIPAGLGAVEVGMVVLVEALTGQPSLGLSVALLRRGREIFFIAWGLTLAWLEPPLAAAPGAASAGAPDP